jgi:hypothetical protein
VGHRIDGHAPGNRRCGGQGLADLNKGREDADPVGVVRPGGLLRGRRPLLRQFHSRPQVCGERAERPAGPDDRGARLGGAEHGRYGRVTPAEPRTKPVCCDAETASPPVDADLAARLETGLAEFAHALQSGGAKPRRR